jgi:hypothetical protein
VLFANSVTCSPRENCPVPKHGHDENLVSGYCRIVNADKIIG